MVDAWQVVQDDCKRCMKILRCWQRCLTVLMGSTKSLRISRCQLYMLLDLQTPSLFLKGEENGWEEPTACIFKDVRAWKGHISYGTRQDPMMWRRNIWRQLQEESTTHELHQTVCINEENTWKKRCSFEGMEYSFDDVKMLQSRQKFHTKEHEPHYRAEEGYNGSEKWKGRISTRKITSARRMQVRKNYGNWRIPTVET